jgi:hypothetical protein
MNFVNFVKGGVLGLKAHLKDKDGIPPIGV